MASDDRIDIELFEFPNNEQSESNCEFLKQVSCIIRFKAQMSKGSSENSPHGGKQRMSICEYYPGDKPYRIVYCEDPFGNLVEIYSHSY